jgi:hypothetical protein
MKEKYRKKAGYRKIKIIRKGGDDREGRKRKSKRERQKIEEKIRKSGERTEKGNEKKGKSE